MEAFSAAIPLISDIFGFLEEPPCLGDICEAFSLRRWGPSFFFGCPCCPCCLCCLFLSHPYFPNLKQFNSLFIYLFHTSKQSSIHKHEEQMSLYLVFQLQSQEFSPFCLKGAVQAVAHASKPLCTSGRPRASKILGSLRNDVLMARMSKKTGTLPTFSLRTSNLVILGRQIGHFDVLKVANF